MAWKVPEDLGVIFETRQWEDRAHSRGLPLFS